MATIRSHDRLTSKPLVSGERWIVVHRDGGHAKGQRVLVRENLDGSTTTVGGAGRDTTYRKMSKMDV